MGEEIDRLTSELEKAHAQGAPSMPSAQERQTHAEEAEHRAEAAEHRAEEAERELSRIQCSFPEFENILRAMSQAYANVTGQNQDLNPTGQGERHARSQRSDSDQDILVTGDGNNPVSGRPSMRNTRGGSQNSGNTLPHDLNALSRLGSHLRYGSSSGSSLSSRLGSLKRSFEPAVGDPEGPSLRRPPPPLLTHPRESLPDQLSFAETIGPGNRNAGLSHVAGWGTDLTNRPEHHANMQAELPAVDKAFRLATGNSPQMPQDPSRIPGIPTASTAPPVQKRSTPVPGVRMASWDFQGPVVRPGTVTSFFKEWLGEDGSDSEGNSEPEAEAMSSVAARKQPEPPSPAKEASSATRCDPPKPTGTQ